MTNEQYDRLMGRLDDIEALLQPRKTGKTEAVDPRTDLTRARVEALETLFWKLVNTSREKKRDAYKVPHVLLGERGQANIEAVVVSVLLNQASLRKVFRTAGLGDSNKEHPLDRARRALTASNLVVMPFPRTTLETRSESLIALSPGEALRLARRTAEVPPAKGWTTSERATGFEGPFGYVEAPDDPCGVRVWPGDEESTVKAGPRIVIAPLDEDVEDEPEVPATGINAPEWPVSSRSEEPRKHPVVSFTVPMK